MIALILSLLTTPLATQTAAQQACPSARAQELAAHAAEQHAEQVVQTLADLIAFDTFQRAGVANAEHPSFQAMTAYLERVAAEFGLDFADHGAVVVIGLGTGSERLGVVTHGDVQPADATKWAHDPFSLDLASEPGRLVGRGVEDDKGPIACALYAMKAIADKQLALERRIELIISYTEESDWAPFQEYLASHPAPALNIGIDAEYPVVIAEKGWCSVNVSLPVSARAEDSQLPELTAFTGGFFLSQVPEDALAVIARPDPKLERELRAAALGMAEVTFEFEAGDGQLTVRAHGTSAHSSTPEDGRNAITHLAALLATRTWPAGAPAQMVQLIDDLVGTGYLAERFGELAYEDPFMGPLTLSFGTLSEQDGRLVGGINLRRPVGRTEAQVRASISAALDDWKTTRSIKGLEYSAYIGEPHAPREAPHIPILLDTFRFYTGIEQAAPISIGGGTHARLVPNGVNFGPAMPGVVYTGHSEHEFMTLEQLVLNLRMYTSALVDLAAG